jgi:hypothetical protein
MGSARAPSVDATATLITPSIPLEGKKDRSGSMEIRLTIRRRCYRESHWIKTGRATQKNLLSECDCNRSSGRLVDYPLDVLLDVGGEAGECRGSCLCPGKKGR